MSVASTLVVIALVLLGVSGLLVTVRLLCGPSTLDRLVALDALVALIICVLVGTAALTGDSSTVPVVVATSLVGFLGSTTVARFLGRGSPRGSPGSTIPVDTSGSSGSGSSGSGSSGSGTSEDAR